MNRRDALVASVAAFLFPLDFLKGKTHKQIKEDLKDLKMQCLPICRHGLEADMWQNFDEYLEEGWELALEEVADARVNINKLDDPVEAFAHCITGHTAQTMVKRKVKFSCGTDATSSWHMLNEYGEFLLTEFRERINEA